MSLQRGHALAPLGTFTFWQNVVDVYLRAIKYFHKHLSIIVY